MLGPYFANKDGMVSYRGNKVFKQIKDIMQIEISQDEFEKRVWQFNESVMWQHIAKINHQINLSTNEYFVKIGALFTLLPLTTRMISSPGAVYGREAINYTTDTSPITLKWFDMPQQAFLSESSQIYLELSLMQQDVDHVYSIYNSFRKERADPTHLSEFHHIEYEGKVDQSQNEKIALGLIQKIVSDLLEKNKENLSFFLDDDRLKQLKEFTDGLHKAPRITFKEALGELYNETGNKKYKEFTLRSFGFWEEVKLTEIYKNIVIIKEFPLLEVPFYHALVKNKEPKVANSADFIWPGYREILGSGYRIRSEKELDEKAKIFNLPKEDYEPYLQTRKLSSYKPTSGFGLGWERFLHGLLEMPFIWNAVHFPRVDKTLKP